MCWSCKGFTTEELMHISWSVGVLELELGDTEPTEWAGISTPYGGIGLDDAGGVPMLCSALSP